MRCLLLVTCGRRTGHVLQAPAVTPVRPQVISALTGGDRCDANARNVPSQRICVMRPGYGCYLGHRPTIYPLMNENN